MPEEEYDKVAKEECPHLGLLDEEVSTAQDRESCEVCGEAEHLRVCLTCGKVHCCESENAHDQDHYEATDHPFIQPHAREKYDFLWCYACEAYLT